MKFKEIANLVNEQKAYLDTCFFQPSNDSCVNTAQLILRYQITLAQTTRILRNPNATIIPQVKKELFKNLHWLEKVCSSHNKRVNHSNSKHRNSKEQRQLGGKLKQIVKTRNLLTSKIEILTTPFFNDLSSLVIELADKNNLNLTNGSRADEYLVSHAIYSSLKLGRSSSIITYDSQIKKLARICVTDLVEDRRILTLVPFKIVEYHNSQLRLTYSSTYNRNKKD